VTAWQVVAVLYAAVLALAAVVGFVGGLREAARPAEGSRSSDVGGLLEGRRATGLSRAERRADRARVRAEVADWLAFEGITAAMPEVAERGRRIVAAGPQMIPHQRQDEEE
jgi:hypothetical protein